MFRSANYFDGDYVGSGTSSYPTGNALTDGGAYGGGSLSRYDTADQAGNLWEWNDAVIAAERGIRGGCFENDGPAENLSSLHRGAANPSLEDMLGVPGADTAVGNSTGAAYVFVRSGTVWGLQAKLTATAGAVYDFFGSSVALSGDSALVGAPSDDTAVGTDAGSAYVFIRNGTVPGVCSGSTRGGRVVEKIRVQAGRRSPGGKRELARFG